jgi:hypothetical protein
MVPILECHNFGKKNAGARSDGVDLSLFGFMNI